MRKLRWQEVFHNAFSQFFHFFIRQVVLRCDGNGPNAYVDALFLVVDVFVQEPVDPDTLVVPGFVEVHPCPVCQDQHVLDRLSLEAVYVLDVD